MVSRNNHYLSQMYLRNWTRNRKVQVYNLLVPDERVLYGWREEPLASVDMIVCLLDYRME